MLRRVNHLTKGGTALNNSKITLYSNPFQRHSPLGSPQFSRRQRATKFYLFCSVVGIIATTSIGEDKMEDLAPLELPGRPHNLTDEQKTKLKEMWNMAFKVFGLPSSEFQNDADIENSEPTQKKGAKIANVFKKKKVKASSSIPLPDVTSDVSNLSISEKDDKYSQSKDFKEALANSTPQEIRDTFWKMVKADHPDSLFLRFLRARKWEVSKAIVMLVATMRWRSKEMDVSSPFCNQC